jgi:poly(A) polymerase
MGQPWLDLRDNGRETDRMTASISIGQQPWMTAPDTVAVLDALEARGGPDCARFVGGCVRNTLIGKPIDDIDIATTLTPDHVQKALQVANIASVPTGIEHGTITAVIDKKPFEITTLRRDVETDGRRAVVAFTMDWEEDALRRDFTMNSLYARRTGEVFDATGRGVTDAKAGRVMFVGDAEERIKEDYLRVLRFFRFYALYSKVAPNAEALNACAAHKAGLKTLASERVAKEMLKMLSAQDPRAAVGLMDVTQILQTILGCEPNLKRFNGLVKIETEQLFTANPLLRFAALLPDDQIAATAICEHLRLSNSSRDRIVGALAPTPKLKSWMSPREVRRAVYASSQDAVVDRATLAWASAKGTGAGPQWRALIALAESWTPPEFPLTGDDVMSAGVGKGPKVGEVLREVEDWWIDHDFIDDKLAAAEKLKAVVQGMTA